MASPGIGPVRQKLNEVALEAYMNNKLPPTGDNAKQKIVISQFKNGQSNPTYLIQRGVEKYVLRMKPRGKLLDKSAHDTLREYTIMDALQLHDMPVPKMYCYCDDVSIVGSEFYLMEYKQGIVIWDTQMKQIPPSKRRHCWMELVRVLAALHRINPHSIEHKIQTGWLKSKPISEFKDFYPRQIKRLGMVSRKQAQVPGTPQIPDLDDLLKWFSDNCVNDETCLMHGDYKLDNVIYSQDLSRIIAVIDWELSTLGHPLADLANMLQMFYATGKYGVLTGLADSSDPNVPSADELLKYYCQLTGKKYPIEGWAFSLAFSFFKMSVILQGVAARNATGQASSAEAKLYGSLTIPLANYAWKTIRTMHDTTNASKL